MTDEGAAKHILFVLGVHRPETTRLARALAIAGLGAGSGTAAVNRSQGHEQTVAKDHPAETCGVDDAEIVAINDALLAIMGADRQDIAPVPDDWARDVPTELRDRAVRAVQRAARDATVSSLDRSSRQAAGAMIAAPNLWRVLGFWLDLAAREGVVPLVLCGLSDPMGTAGAMQPDTDYAPSHARLVWLRALLDAEAGSRGHPRAFADLDKLGDDAEDTLRRAAQALGLTLEITPETVAALESVAREPGLQAAPGSVPPEAGASDPLGEAVAILSGWAEKGETAGDLRALDRLRAALDASSPLIEGALAEARAPEATAGRTVVAPPAQSPVVGGDAMARLTAELWQARSQREATSRQLVGTLSALGAANAALAKARRKPLTIFADLLIYRLLMALASERSPLSPRSKMRFQRSAAKRDPNRSIASSPELTGPKTRKAASAPAPQAGGAGGGKAAGKERPTTGEMPVRADLPNLLIVSHDASWTGAPLVVYNLARTFSDRYNVTIVTLKGGALLPALSEVAVNVVVLGISSVTGTGAGNKLARLLRTQSFDFAVVNSVESRHVLKTLREAKVATVSLLHEFAAYTLPRTAFPDAFEWSDHVVFSTNLTLANAIETTGVSPSRKVHVFPQGKCIVPHKSQADSDTEAERARLKSILRPAGGEADFLVIGAGYVEIRKGVDLFIEVARRTLARANGARIRFAWIGAGYAPEVDTAYSVYLQDQLQRAGIADRITMLGVTSEIEYVYELADAFVLTSRLDPLPNVAIDAMQAGLPLVCFDRASGIPDILRGTPLEAECIVDYLDTACMSDQVLRLVQDPEAYRNISQAISAHARATFDLGAYAARIERLGRAASHDEGRARDERTLEQSETFDPAFMLPPSLAASRPGMTRGEAAAQYLQSFSEGASMRRPEPGFNPAVYTMHRLRDGDLLADPYAEFLRAGRPVGPWTRPLISGPMNGVAGAPADCRVALHIHAYYVDQLPRILSHLAANATRPDLLVSVTSDVDRSAASEMLRQYGGASCVSVVPNLGRDIGPLLTEFGARLVADYDVVGHVHTKKSLVLDDPESVEAWMAFLMQNLLGGDVGGAMLDGIMDAFVRQDDLGLVFAADPNILSWSLNAGEARKLAPRLGLDSDVPAAFDFPVGTMFWIRAAALAPFVQLDLGWDDYPKEPLAYDGTMLHALERLFGLTVEAHGFKTALTNVKDMTR
ncbi:glycosyltransferase [Pseudooceanicola sediminis]|uniref:Glycosyltransferase n=1 Tax=Pseudooceanicola sediminis TaxID=2211117 RepID=A0A399J465_9RHOB|nr:rhamnan synthesis F family protein [Pseudooceanicola sediminis]KAA2311454.1 glycosyltransferase [Puniceibacterium sp. HSS470]RII40061.1 glycosyltransferase [Pseudooceanicola sediminis]